MTTGTVTFTQIDQYGTNVWTGPVYYASSSGGGSFTNVGFVGIGSYTLTVQYNGDNGTDAASTSNTVSPAIKPPLLPTTTTWTLTSQGSNVSYPLTGAVVTYPTEMVFPAPLTVAPDGGKVKTYGQTFNAFTGTLTTLLNGDNATPSFASNGAAATAPAGTYDITVTNLTWGDNASWCYNITYKTATHGLTVNKAPLAVTAHNVTITAGSAIPTLTAAITGFVNNETSSIVSGSPSVTTTATTSSPAGTYPITVSAGSLSAANYSFTPVNGTLTILASPNAPAIAAATLPAGTTGASYSMTLSASGGTPPYAWSLVSGLPPGLTLTSDGKITGTPTSPLSNAAFTVQVTDKLSATATKSFTITILQALAITTSALVPGSLGTGYNQQLTAIGGGSTYTWSIVTGTLPAGVTLAASGTLSGTPAISTATLLPPCRSGTPYSQYLAATGGNPPDTWSLSSGALPAGITLSTSGLISGTPAANGTFNFSAQVGTVTLGGVSAPVSFAGLAPGFVGLYQINVQVPPGALSGITPLVVSQNGAASKAVSVAIQ